jgi:hypothetical protein
MPKSLHERIVARARELITRPGSWVQGGLAFTRDGREVEPTDPEAEQFCAVGALIRASAEITGRGKGAVVLARRLHAEMMRFAGKGAPRQMEKINDGENGQFAILTLFDIYLVAHPAMASLEPAGKRQAPRRDDRATVH